MASTAGLRAAVVTKSRLALGIEANAAVATRLASFGIGTNQEPGSFVGGSSPSFVPLHLARHHVPSRAFSTSRRAVSSTTTTFPAPVPADVELRKNLSDNNKGKGMFARRRFLEGEVVLDSPSPLIAVPDLGTAAITCQACFRAVSGTPVLCDDCGAVYCSTACREHSKAVDGHDVICGSTKELDAYCTEKRQNFPRVAAYMLARSFSGSVDFIAYWSAVNELVGMPVPSDPAKLPRLWHDGFALVKATLSKRMTAGADAFFDTAFNVRTYARLMGNLRLNSFSMLCPLGAEQVTPASASSSSASAAPGAAEAGSAPTDSSAPACSSGGSGGCSTSADGTPDDGCCSTNPDAQADESWYGLEGPRGGTVLHHLPSFVNHECDPNLHVVMGPFGGLQLVARRAIPAGQELSITYLDSSMQVNKRRGKLLHGYGFECQCDTCKRQLAEAQKEAARIAREARQQEEEEKLRASQ